MKLLLFYAPSFWFKTFQKVLESKTVVLHSFNHLSGSKAGPEFAGPLIEEARERLERSGYTVGMTPFGYLNEWNLHVAGDSLAKVFKEL